MLVPATRIMPVCLFSAHHAYWSIFQTFTFQRIIPVCHFSTASAPRKSIRSRAHADVGVAVRAEHAAEALGGGERYPLRPGHVRAQRARLPGAERLAREALRPAPAPEPTPGGHLDCKRKQSYATVSHHRLPHCCVSEWCCTRRFHWLQGRTHGATGHERETEETR